MMSKQVLFILLFLLIPLSVRAGDPLEVFSGGRELPYPTVDQGSGGTQKVKISGKDVMQQKAQPGNSLGQESQLPDWFKRRIISQGADLPMEIPDDPEFDPLADEDQEKEGEPDFIGTWTQIALNVDGAPQPHSSAQITFKKDSFISTSTCTAQGTLTYTENTITLVMTSTDCPGNLPLPMTVVYRYEISEDGTTLSWSTANLSEVFVRNQ